MPFYRAYDIKETVEARETLVQEQVDNIESIISIVEKGINLNRIRYQVPDPDNSKNHPLVRYNNKVLRKNLIGDKKRISELDILANKLLYAEQVVDNNGNTRRNKKIKEGLLFARCTDKSLTLLKLEEITIVDKVTFKPIDGLSLDKQYYKVVFFEKDNWNNISVVDRNKKVAKYWATTFLELERSRDEYTNTKELLEYLENDKLINFDDIGFEDKEYNEIKCKIRNYILENNIFDKEEIFSSINIDHKKYDVNSDDFFESSVFDSLDTEFSLDKEAIREKYRRRIRVSSDVSVDVGNIYWEKKRNNIRLERNKLVLTIDEKYKKDIENLMGG